MARHVDFEWDTDKDKLNQEKHGVSFALAQLALLDHQRIILEDLEHSEEEQRFYCLGNVAGGILTVRLRIDRIKGTSIYLFRASIASLIGARNPHVLCVHSGFCAPFALHLKRS